MLYRRTESKMWFHILNLINHIIYHIHVLNLLSLYQMLEFRTKNAALSTFRQTLKTNKTFTFWQFKIKIIPPKVFKINSLNMNSILDNIWQINYCLPLSSHTSVHELAQTLLKASKWALKNRSFFQFIVFSNIFISQKLLLSRCGTVKMQHWVFVHQAVFK